MRPRSAISWMIIHAAFCAAQTPTTFSSGVATHYKLEARGTPIVTSIPAQGVLGSAQCDANGYIYLRPLGPDVSLASPVIAIKPDGQEGAQYKIDGIPQFTGKTIVAPAFTVDAFSRLYYIVEQVPQSKDDERRNYIVSFGHDGQLRSAIQMEGNVMPYTAAVFNSGKFFVLGIEASGEVEQLSSGPVQSSIRKPVAAVFDENGKMLRRIRTIENSAEMAGSEGAKASPAMINAAARLGPDGSIYLLQTKPKATLHVISESGQETRTVDLETPSRESTATDFRVLPGRILVRFAEPIEKANDGTALPRKIEYSLYDSMSGSVLGVYDETPSTRGLLACADAGEITLIVPSNDNFALVHADIAK